MRQLFHSLLFIAILLTSMLTSAQDDPPLTMDINYDMTVEENLTDYAFFDWWYLQVEAGDVVSVAMQANDGLQPLLGLLNASAELVARSDTEQAAEINGTAFMQYTATEDGQYTIIATREGRDQGTTTGRYRLTVINKNNPQLARPNPFLETEFRCSEMLLTNALTFQFSEDYLPPEDVQPGQMTEYYRISVYGLDGFEPAIRLIADILQDRPLDCTDSARASAGSSLSLPFLDEPYVITTEDGAYAAIEVLTNSGPGDPLGNVTVSIGAKDGTSGRFIVVLEGMKLHEREDTDEFIVRRGAFARESALDIYMIGYPNNRLDPLMEMSDNEANIYQLCDDIGNDDCQDILPITSATLVISEDKATYSADRFDAGLRIDTPNNSDVLVTLSSHDRSTAGEYLVVFAGELPSR